MNFIIRLLFGYLLIGILRGLERLLGPVATGILVLVILGFFALTRLAPVLVRL